MKPVEYTYTNGRVSFFQTEKMCKQCKKVLPVSEFYPIKTVKINPYDVYCKECRKERSRSDNKKRRLLKYENSSVNMCF